MAIPQSGLAGGITAVPTGAASMLIAPSNYRWYPIVRKQ